MATARETFAGIEDRLMIHGKPVSQLKTEELKSELELRGLTTSGSRKNLQDRLCEYLEIERERSTTEYSSTSDTQETDKKDASPKSENGSKEDSIEKNEKDQSESKEKQVKKDPDEKEMNEAYDPAESESNNSEMKAKLMQKDMPEVEEGEIVGQDEEKKNKVQKTSQPEKKRRISLTRQKSNATPTPGSRKRKWSSMSSKNKSSVVISTGSLKGLIPGVQLASTPALEAVMDLDDEKEDEEMIADKQKEEKEPEIEDNVSDSKPEERNSSKKRIVHVEESKKVKLNNSATADIADIEMDVNPNGQQHPSEGMVTGTTTHEEDLPSSSAPSPETNLKPNREVSPPRNPPSVVIHVSNLVRPFTQKQLNELLAQYGPLAEGGFWINKIKSHCYVTYTSVEDAKIARDGLHGQRWPATSPKFLSVDFGEEEQMAKDTEGNLGKKKDDADQKEKEKEKENEKEKGKEKEKEKEKEKDKGKEKESRRHKERKEQKQKEEPSAANLLDKLFRKTTTMPCIYWLPLTKEQIAKKDNERDERRKQRQLAIQEEEKQRADRLKVREKEGDTGREKERERSRGRERQPLRDNRAQTPSSKIRSDRRSADLKKRSRSRSKEIGSRRDDNRRR